MNQDLVSIITPSYNTENYILDTIRSVQAQTYTNWEMIIVDDCSTDNTIELVKKYIEDTDETRIHLLTNEKNSGAAVSRNYALREARGRWIAFLDSDDLWLPEKLKKQISFMEENNYSFSYTKYEEIDEESKSLGREISGPNHITKSGMYNYCWPGCLTVMYDAKVVGLVQIADIKKNNDYAMWLKVCKKSDCYLLGEMLAKYRRRNGSISNHGYIKLVKWHLKLFHEAEKYNILTSLIMTGKNLCYGVWKKVRYVKKS